MQYIIKGKIEKCGGLVDYIADGVCFKGEDLIPCRVGFEVDSYDDLTPTYIFIRDGITASGNHYHSETIKL